jgi:hypothetical protein
VYQQPNPQQPYGHPQHQQPQPYVQPGAYQPAAMPPQPSYPPGAQGFHPGAPPPPPPRKRSGGAVALVVVLALLLVGGGAGAWWFLSERDGGDGPGAAEAKGLYVEDSESGIAYSLPDTWEQTPSDDLIDAYTSSASVATDSGGASVFAFSGEAMTDGEMSFTTSTVAGENSEFFYPYAEDRQILVSEPAEVDGREAYRFTWEVDKADDDPMYGHIVHILTDDNRSVFLMGIVHPDDPDLRTEIDAALTSVTLQ